MKINDNERSWVIELISDMNEFLNNNQLKIQRVSGEKTINTESKVMFPDILLFGDKKRRTLLQGWEVKMPDVSIDNSDLISDAERKAESLNLNSFVIWNFRYGVLYIKDEKGDFCREKIWDDTSFINTREDVDTYESKWSKLIKKIILELNDFLEGDILKPANLENLISDRIMEEIIKKNQYSLANKLENESLKRLEMRNELKIWWGNVKKEYRMKTENKFEAYAKKLLLDWLNKILFSHLIKRNFSIAKEIKNIDYNTKTKELIKLFKKISNKCDFYNVFQKLDYSELLTENSRKDLISFSKFLESNYIEDLPTIFLHNILENTINTSKRLLNGQYVTPPNLAKLLVNLSIDNLSGNCFDPCCGTGTIPKKIIEYKIDNNIESIKAQEQTWASDMFSFALQISNLNMIDKNNINVPAKLFKKNVFELQEDDIIEIVNPENGDKIQYNLPLFDNIVSNLPFVESNNSKNMNKEYKKYLVKDIKKHTKIDFSAKADLYMLIIFKLWNILKMNGRLGIITSNSWLGTAAGKDFFKILRYYYNIQGIYIKEKGKWFNEPDVITTLIILEKKEIAPPDKNNDVNFFVIKKELINLKNNDNLKKIIIQSTSSENLYPKIINKNTYSDKEISELLQSKVSLNTLFFNINWLIEIKEKLIPLTKLFNVERGTKAGKNNLFYFKESEDIPIDDKFIIDGIKDLKDTNYLMVTENSLNKKIFYCKQSPEELKNNGYLKTYKWVKSNIDNLNKSLNDRVKSGKEWYDLGPIKKFDLATLMNPNERFFVAKVNENYYFDQRVIGLIQKNKEIDLDLVHALLNSILGMFYIEAIGFGRGQGVLDISKNNFAEIFILDPELISEKDINNIKEKFNKLLNRKILKCQEELKMDDRFDFDMAVLKAFNIEKFYDNIKNTLLKLQKKRLSV